MLQLDVRAESFPLAGAFTISRGTKTSAEVVVAELSDGRHRGRGECVPYARYGETVPGVIEALAATRPALAHDPTPQEAQALLPAGAARNALDCALWDLAAKRAGRPVWELAGLAQPPGPLVSAYTLSLDTPEAMGRAAAANARRPLMKLKLTGEGDLERVRAVRAGAPEATLIVDANEAWRPEMIEPYGAAMKELGVAMIEQPLPADADAALGEIDHPVAICADEAAHDRAGLAALVGRYDMINVKLDKTGGLTEALALKRAAEAAGLKVMVGCMVASSLAMAPAFLVAQGAAFVDLDGPLLLARDRAEGLRFDGSRVDPPDPALWG